MLKKRKGFHSKCKYMSEQHTEDKNLIAHNLMVLADYIVFWYMDVALFLFWTYQLKSN